MLVPLLLLLACPSPSKQESADSSPGGDTDSAAPPDTSGGTGTPETGEPSSTCGDGVVEGTESCDEGAANGTSPCGCQGDCGWASTTAPCEDGDLCTVLDLCDGAGACAPGGPADCDDGDACTADTCDPGSGTCSHVAFSGTGPDLYDMALLKDPSTLDLEVLSTTTEWEGLVAVTVHEVRYTSYEYTDCALGEIALEAYVGVPPGVSSANPAPGVVVAHGLGGMADAGAAATPAGQWGVVSLAFSGPGQGASEGTGCTVDHLFDTVPFPGDSWFFEHSVAAIRGITALESLPEVDPSRLGMTGYSGGSVVTYMVNGVDDRLTAAAPVSATGYLDLAIAATPVPGWEYDLLQSMVPPRDASSPEWASYVQYLDPKNFLSTPHGATLVLNGAQDEFFPLSSLVATLNDLAAADDRSRVVVLPNWDHGWWAMFNDEEPVATAEASLAAWMKGQLGLDPGLEEIPPVPSVEAVSPWTCLYDGWYPYSCAAVLADVGTPGYDVDRVTFWFSVDNGVSFFSWDLEEYGGGLWYGEVEILDGAVQTADNTVWFVSVEYREGWLGASFEQTSLPHLPPGFVPSILPMDDPFSGWPTG